MGAYQCSKCDVMLDYYKYTNNSNNNSCRIHSYDSRKLLSEFNEKKICNDCNTDNGNCVHKFKYKIYCYNIK